jgi:hypothetical protein
MLNSGSKFKTFIVQYGFYLRHRDIIYTLQVNSYSPKLSLLSFFLQWDQRWVISTIMRRGMQTYRSKQMVHMTIYTGTWPGRAGPHSALCSIDMIASVNAKNTNLDRKETLPQGSICHCWLVYARPVWRTLPPTLASTWMLFLSWTPAVYINQLIDMGVKLSILFRPSSLFTSCHPRNIKPLTQFAAKLRVTCIMNKALPGFIRRQEQPGSWTVRDKERRSYPMHIHVLTCLHESQMIAWQILMITANNRVN